MAEQPGRKAFLIHLAAYVVANAVLVGFNASQTPEPGQPHEWWAIWPLIGWGIGVLAHGFAVWMEGRSREGSLLADPDARGVAVHLFVYMAVNAFLIAVNLSKSPDSIWAIWPILGWGIGLAAHAWLAYRKVLRRTMERYATEQQILAQIQLEQQAAAIASAIEPLQEPVPEMETKAPPTRRKRAAAKKKPAARRSAKTAAQKPAAKKPAGKAAAKPGKTTTKRKTTAKRKPASRAKKPASRKST